MRRRHHLRINISLRQTHGENLIWVGLPLKRSKEELAFTPHRCWTLWATLPFTFAISNIYRKGAVWSSYTRSCATWRRSGVQLCNLLRKLVTPEHEHEKLMEICFSLMWKKRMSNKWSSAPVISDNALAKPGVEKEWCLTTIRKQLLLLKPVIGVPRLHSATTILLPASQ